MKIFALSLLSLLTLLSFAQDSHSTNTTMQETDTMHEAPAWQSLELTNAATGETFTLGDFEDKTVFVEPFATWCGNCRRQLTNVSSARSALEQADDVVVIALSVAENVSNDVLAAYAEDNNFTDFTFASASPELLAALVTEFGRGLTSPPSTPHFIINADGTYSALDTGFESSEEILGQLNAALGS